MLKRVIFNKEVEGEFNMEKEKKEIDEIHINEEELLSYNSDSFGIGEINFEE